MSQKSDEPSLPDRIKGTRRKFLAGLGGLAAAGAASAKLGDDDDSGLQAGGLNAPLGAQYYRDQYVSSDPSTFDPSVMQAGEQYWLSDGEMGVYDGDQTQQYPVGSTDNPVPEVNAINAGVGSLNADLGQFGDSNNYRWAGRYGDGTLNDCVTDIPSRDQDARAAKHVYVEPRVFDENIDIVDPCVHMWGQGQASQINQGDADHTVHIKENDVFLDDLAIDHNGTGSSDPYDAVHVDTNAGDEIQLFRCSVDGAPRYGFNIQVKHCHIVGCEGTGGRTASMRVAAPYVQVIGYKIQNPTGKGVLWDGNRGTFSGVFEQTSGPTKAFELTGSANKISLVADDDNANPSTVMDIQSGAYDNMVDLQTWQADTALRLNGHYNTVRVKSDSTATESITVGGSAESNTVHANVDGSLTLKSGSQYNVVTGRIGGSITDNGSHNVVNGRLTSPPYRDLAGASKSLSYTRLPVDTYRVEVEDTSSGAVIEGIDGIAEDGQTVVLLHRGGNAISLDHSNANATNPLRNKGATANTLDNHGIAVYHYSETQGAWYEQTVNSI